MKVLGIDGCRGGWVAAVLRPGSSAVSFGLYATLRDLWSEHSDAIRVFIDIPVGLPAMSPRECDRLVRRQLGRRACTVFSVPCRRAAYAEDYASACEINERILGRRLSRQTWNIIPKIIEADRFLSDLAEREVFFESHPELCFAAWNGGVPLASSKKSQAGRWARLSLLRHSLPSIAKRIEEVGARLRRQGAQADDLTDACVLALSAAVPPSQLRHYPAQVPRDARGLPMVITAPLPSAIGLHS